MDCSTPGFPVLHHLPEFAQTHVHWIGDAIQPSHSLSSASPPALNPSQNQGLFHQLFTSSSQNIGASASASVLPKNIHGWFPLRLNGLIILLSKGLSRVFSSTIIQKHQFFQCWAFFMVQHPYMTTGKTVSLTIWTFIGKVMSFLFNMLSRFVIFFLSKMQASSNFVAAVTICSDFRAQEEEICHCFHLFPFYLPWSDRTKCHDLTFLNAKF